MKGGRDPFFFSGQQHFRSLSTPPLFYWLPKASNAISTLFTPSQSPQTQVATRGRGKKPHMPAKDAL